MAWTSDGGSGSSSRLWLPMVLLLCCSGLDVESETSYTWRLDMDVGKVMPASHFPQPPPNSIPSPPQPQETQKSDPGVSGAQLQETVLDILLSTVTSSDGSWKKTSREQVCISCDRPTPILRNNRGIAISSTLSSGQQSLSRRIRNRISASFTGDDFIFDFTDLDEVNDDDVLSEELDCGKSVNFTFYDHLVGIQNRQRHPKLPQPEVALYFKTKRPAKAYTDVDIDAVEKVLKILKLDKPKSVELYQQQANYWRVKGDNTMALECFRRALAVAPNNAEILLNTARLLFHLQFLDDAIFLTRRSLEVQPPDKNAWAQHLQLGEILKAYCHYQEAALHLRHVLELKPNHEPALKALKEMESIPDAKVHIYTIVIIIVLVLAVLLWIISTLEFSCAEEDECGAGPVGHKARILKRLNVARQKR